MLISPNTRDPCYNIALIAPWLRLFILTLSLAYLLCKSVVLVNRNKNISKVRWICKQISLPSVRWEKIWIRFRLSIMWRQWLTLESVGTKTPGFPNEILFNQGLKYRQGFSWWIDGENSPKDGRTYQKILRIYESAWRAQE